MNAPANPFDLQLQPNDVPVIPGPGFYTGLSNAEYHSGPGISKSGLDLVAHCPSSLPWSKAAPVDEVKTKALNFGTALHCLLLEPHEFDKQFIVAPEFNRRTNDGKAEREAFQVEHDDKIIMTADEWRQLQIMLDSVQAHPTARWIFEQQGMNEASIYWTDEQTGELCRVRPDRILIDHHIIVDVKAVAGLDRFYWHAVDFRYFVQDAMYSAGYESHFGVRPSFWFLAVSTTANCGRYPVMVYELNADMKTKGEEEFRRCLEIYHRCRTEDDWVHVPILEKPVRAI